MSSPAVTRRGAQKAKIQTRGMLRKQEAKTSSVTLQEIKRKAKQKMETKSSSPSVVKDIYHTATNSIQMVRGETGLVYDNRMAEHRCLWDLDHTERPERFTRIMERCAEMGLIERCKRIATRDATEQEILTKHTQAHLDLLKSTSHCTDEEKLEDLSSRFDAIFIHPSTYELSVLAAGSTIELIDHILQGTVQNGMAVIRPPGHHAMKAEFNGYCLLNNVAIAAQWALDQHRAERILIIDWDVHHGQGTQRFFYDDPRVLYFSIHRFEWGTFWPNLRESDYDYVGDGAGHGFNFNVPLNQIGMTNGDYLAIVQQILMPVAVEFQPDLVIVSSGYDAALGCPEGEMEITPACYAHLLSPLLTLANGKVAVILEGGYCLQSLAEGAAHTLRALLGDPCPLLVEPIQPPTESMQETILNCIYAHRPFWKCFQMLDTYSLEELNNLNPQRELHQIVKLFKGGPPPPERYPTRNTWPVQTQDSIDGFAKRLTSLTLATKLDFPITRVCYVYDENMLHHKNLQYLDHPEKPERIEAIFNRFKEYGLLDRLVRVPARFATTDELCRAHSKQHINLIRRIVDVDDDGLFEEAEKYNSVYFHPKTYDSATLAAGSVLQVVDDVLIGKSLSGVCIVRPPGHHAEHDEPHGFCIFNNVSVAAQHAINVHNLKRVLIIDWDVHHGNGTQHIFDKNPNVLYVSVHRYDNGTFFPKSKDGDYTAVGTGSGEGFNLNIPWNKKGMGDMEYAMAFQRIIMPIAYEFNPELVLISAGFDAAIGDPLGGCKVTPEAYGHFTHWLSSLANGRVVLILEGGYNVNSISYAMTMCTKALLGDPMPSLQNTHKVNDSCCETLNAVQSVHQKYWSTMQFAKKLPDYEDGQLPTYDISKHFAKIRLSNEVVDGDDNDDDDDEKPGTSNIGADQTVASSSGLSSSGNTTKNQTLSDYLTDNLQALQNEEMYAVYPLNDCPHLSLLSDDPSSLTSINTKQVCSQCDSTQENWFCLHCYETCCGRYINEHMLHHFLHTDHPLTLSFADLSVWCYKCEAYIDNPRLFAYKNLAHLDKFGEEMVWSYDALVLEQQH